ncbi:MAG TPA: lysophospholipid acyltransferase family protein [Actinomycetota bacterium]|nr:lysophospholipid acyltransferase family protein [Actinomycetota bacterium]
MPEPWYPVAWSVVIPPAWLLFSWHLEGIERIPASGPALIACNHASYLDPIANAYAVVKAGRRPRFLAKRELFEIRLVGSVLRGVRQIPVDRGTGDRTPLRRAEEALAAREVVLVYPEGTVTKRADGLPMEGKTGTVRLALTSGQPIIPMVSWGSAPVWQKSGPGSLKPGRPIWVGVGDPIDLSARIGEAGDFQAVKDMTADLMRVLGEMAADLRDRYPKRWAAGG